MFDRAEDERRVQADPENLQHRLSLIQLQRRQANLSEERIQAAAQLGDPVAGQFAQQFVREAPPEADSALVCIPRCLSHLDEAELRLFFCDCAEFLWPHLERKVSDPQPFAEAIEEARRYAQGRSGADELWAVRRDLRIQYTGSVESERNNAMLRRRPVCFETHASSEVYRLLLNTELAALFSYANVPSSENFNLNALRLLELVIQGSEALQRTLIQYLLKERSPAYA